MNSLKIIELNGQRTVDSREVAEMIEVTHANLLKKIRVYEDILLKSKLTSVDFFIPSEYQDTTGRTLKCYLLTKMGCEMVANKLTGEKGVVFTAKYVEAFNTMESNQLQLQNLSPELQFMIQSEIKLKEHDRRLDQLEGDLPITPSECNLISREVKSRIKKVISENNLIVNNKQRRKLFNEIKHDATIIAGVTQYNYILKKDLDKVIAYINNWYPSGATLAVIMGYEQQSLFKNEHKKRHSTTNQD
jgi:Rha family phage regulatory protein|nr:MAG TPA: regulatory protein [Caudoviricetes sp.]